MFLILALTFLAGAAGGAIEASWGVAGALVGLQAGALLGALAAAALLARR